MVVECGLWVVVVFKVVVGVVRVVFGLVPVVQVEFGLVGVVQVVFGLVPVVQVVFGLVGVDHVVGQLGVVQVGAHDTVEFAVDAVVVGTVVKIPQDANRESTHREDWVSNASPSGHLRAYWTPLKQW